MIWDWSWIDQVYCINLRERVDRYLESQCEFHRVGLCNRVLYYRPEKPSDEEWQAHVQYLKDTNNQDSIMTMTKGAYGCWKSHKAIMEHAMHHNYKRILVFEDDIAFTESFEPSTLHNLANTVQDLPQDADVFHLGYFPLRGTPVMHEGLSTLGKIWSVKALCTVAYMATIKGMETIRNSDLSLPIDFWLTKNSTQYAIFPKVAWQRKSKTDVDERWFGCPTTSVKEFGNYIYRNFYSVVDTLILIIVPIILFLSFTILLAYATHITLRRLIVSATLSSNSISVDHNSLTKIIDQ
jgi:GR25 family glycosyltransferase involved in LPS biosynthesis